MKFSRHNIANKINFNFILDITLVAKLTKLQAFKVGSILLAHPVVARYGADFNAKL